nr:hypothetical protein BgiMline_009356 [Biomphalaria glabrata]
MHYHKSFIRIMKMCINVAAYNRLDVSLQQTSITFNVYPRVDIVVNVIDSFVFLIQALGRNGDYFKKVI